MATTPTAPTIHMNGTSGDVLVDGYVNAHRAVAAAIEALQESAPNGRDYYVQGADVYRSARLEHEARMHKLADVAGELLALIEALVNQQDELTRRKGRA